MVRWSSPNIDQDDEIWVTMPHTLPILDPSVAARVRRMAASLRPHERSEIRARADARLWKLAVKHQTTTEALITAAKAVAPKKIQRRPAGQILVLSPFVAARVRMFAAYLNPAESREFRQAIYDRLARIAAEQGTTVETLVASAEGTPHAFVRRRLGL